MLTVDPSQAPIKLREYYSGAPLELNVAELEQLGGHRRRETVHLRGAQHG